MSNEKIAEIIGKLIFKNGGKNASANYNHVRKLFQQIKYNESHVKEKAL